MAKTTPIQEEPLTTAEVAEEFGITTKAVLGLIQRKRLPNARKLHGKTTTYLIPRSDVDSLKAEREARKLRRKSATSPQKD